ncbi:MAG: type II secretion system F family protein [Candidatus Gastranaerophilales bacterium]|nr:type II secretion system F family protein [Candidatus Gastranaerophilales bacterium]
MAKYNYRASKKNIIIRGQIEAKNASEAQSAVRKMGLTPIKITQDQESALKEKKKITIPKKGLPELSLNDKINFTQTLQILTATGIPIIATLAFMEENAERKKVQIACNVIKTQIIAGATLADTMEKNQKIFGRVYAGLTRAGEDSGELDVTLDRMLTLFKKQASIKSRVIGALVYPVFVVVLAVLVVVVMLAFVFPAFESMFDSLGGKLPKITQMCIDAGHFICDYWWILIIATVVIIYLTIVIFKNEVTRRIIDRIVLKIPLLNSLMRYANYANFLAVLQVSYDAGIPIVNSLYLANLTIENSVLKDGISQAATTVQQGTGLSEALRMTGQIPNMILFMVATGEQSGRLGDMLAHCVTYIDKKLDDIIDTFTKLVEPFMLIVIGGIVLVLALALYMPLFGLYTQL